MFFCALVLCGVIYSIWRRPRVKGKSEPHDLNVIFNYNGHSWDAFEVLGIPAGSSRDRVENAFREACGRVEADSRPFLEAAYHAIRTHKG